MRIRARGYAAAVGVTVLALVATACGGSSGSGSGSSSEVPAGDQVRTEISAPSDGAGRSEVRLVPGSAGALSHCGGR